ncbi:MAG: GNAT family N-acetyltransferase [Sinobacteraceae bacterium]|nr:GNAT family N-acetyltransferase [Pseudomonadales bacterium]MCP5327338.1 GNAT family N-acetyltransferase [Nevskiaceae bacterium]MCP5470740.1 GNAT family N-acetyltransferase [Nevskiaceae bacterium]
MDADTKPAEELVNDGQLLAAAEPRIVNLEVIRDQAAVQSIWEQWRELADGVAFRQPEWLMSWWEHLRPDRSDLFIGVLRDEQMMIRVLAPWYLDRTARTLRCLGDGIVATDYCTVLLDTRFSDDSLAKVFAAELLRHVEQSDEWDSLHLEAIDNHDPAMEAFALEMRALRSQLHRGNCSNTWRIDLHDGWEQFIQGLSHNARKAFRRRVRALDKMDIRWVERERDFEAFFPTLVELHQKRRRALHDAGCFSDPRFEAFLQTAARRLQNLGQLQAFSIWFEGRPIVADIGFRARDRWLCYQSGMDPEAMDLEPGNLANACILMNAAEIGFRTVDFLRGDEPYKSQLRADPHPACDLHLMRPGLLGRLRYLTLEAKARAIMVRDSVVRRTKSYILRSLSVLPIADVNLEVSQVLSPLML